MPRLLRRCPPEQAAAETADRAASAADPAAIRAAEQFLVGAALAGGDALARDALERLRRDSGSG